MTNDMKKQRGAVRKYFGLIGSGAKGALGTESIKQVGQFASATIGAVRLQPCPRCMEKSLLEDKSGYHCVRGDICGFSAAKKTDIDSMRESIFSMSPRVLAISKGFSGDFRVRARGAKRLSWLFWVVTAMLLAYSLSWAIEMRWLYFGWTLVVAVYAAISAIRYAYMSYRLLDAMQLRPTQFLLRPSLWFVG